MIMTQATAAYTLVMLILYSSTVTSTKRKPHLCTWGGDADTAQLSFDRDKTQVMSANILPLLAIVLSK